MEAGKARRIAIVGQATEMLRMEIILRVGRGHYFFVAGDKRGQYAGEVSYFVQPIRRGCNLSAFLCVLCVEFQKSNSTQRTQRNAEEKSLFVSLVAI
jgi:hypothetical protein